MKMLFLMTALLSGDFQQAFQEREDEDDNYVNSPDWRMAEIPSANGHGTVMMMVHCDDDDAL